MLRFPWGARELASFDPRHTLHFPPIKNAVELGSITNIFEAVNQPVKNIDHFINDNFHPSTLMRYLVISRPAISNLLVRCGRAKPSYTGQM